MCACACVRSCVRAYVQALVCARACVHARACLCACARPCVRVCVCVLLVSEDVVMYASAYLEDLFTNHASQMTVSIDGWSTRQQKEDNSERKNRCWQSRNDESSRVSSHNCPSTLYRDQWQANDAMIGGRSIPGRYQGLDKPISHAGVKRNCGMCSRDEFLNGRVRRNTCKRHSAM